jgi:MFS family permease
MRSLHRWLIITLFNSAALQASIYVVRPMITYRALELNGTGKTVGILGALYAILPVLVAVFFGKIVGRIGERAFLIIGSTGVLSSSFLLSKSNSLLTLGLLTAIAGVSHLAVMVGGQTMMANRSTHETYDRDFGYYTFSASFGQMFGPLLGGLVAGSNGVLPRSTSHAFILATLISLIGLVPILLTRSLDVSIKDVVKESGVKVRVVDVMKHQGMKEAMFTSLVISTTIDILTIFIPLLGTELRITPVVVGVILGVRSAASMLSRLFLGQLSQRFSSRSTLVISTTVATFALVAMYFAKDALFLGLVIFIVGFTLGIGQPLTMAWVSRISAPQERAMAITLRLTGNRVGQFGLPIAAGLVVSALGVGSLFLGLAALVGVTAGVCRKNYR